MYTSSNINIPYLIDILNISLLFLFLILPLIYLGIISYNFVFDKIVVVIFFLLFWC